MPKFLPYMLAVMMGSLTAQTSTFPIGGGGGTVPSGANLPGVCAVGSPYIKTGTNGGYYWCSATNTWTPSGNGSTTPYETSFTGTGVTIPSVNHGKGVFPAARLFVGGNYVPTAYSINGQGDITYSNLANGTYVIEVEGAGAYENDYTSVSTITVTSATHGKGLHPAILLFTAGLFTPITAAVNGSGDVTISNLTLGNYHVKIY